MPNDFHKMLLMTQWILNPCATSDRLPAASTLQQNKERILGCLSKGRGRVNQTWCFIIKNGIQLKIAGKLSITEITTNLICLFVSFWFSFYFLSPLACIITVEQECMISWLIPLGETVGESRKRHGNVSRERCL